MISETREVTTLENAPPIIKPSATSMTLSRPRNATVIVQLSKENSNRGNIHVKSS